MIIISFRSLLELRSALIVSPYGGGVRHILTLGLALVQPDTPIPDISLVQPDTPLLASPGSAFEFPSCFQS